MEANKNPSETASFVAAKLKFFDTELDVVKVPPEEPLPEREISPTVELIKGGRGRSPNQPKQKEISQFNFSQS